MSEVKTQVTKIVKAMAEDWAEFQKRQDAGFRELENLLGGGIGIGAKMKHIEAEFAAAWAHRYVGEKYIFDYTVDRKQLKRLLGEGLAHEEIGRRAWVFLADEEQGLIRARHPFLWFLKGINRYAGEKS